MTRIEVNAVDQSLTVESAPLITSGSIQTNEIHFTFSSEWDDFIKTAVFYKSEYHVYHVLLDNDNKCVVPHEVLTEEGAFSFGVFGVKDSTVKTSEILTYRVEQGILTESTDVPNPTTDIYEQILTAIKEAGILTVPITNEEIDSIIGD